VIYYMNIRKIIHKVFDPFGGIGQTQEEEKLVVTLKITKVREKLLSAALTTGEPVQEELDKVRTQIIELINRLPRGDNPAFYALCFWCVGTISAFATLQITLHKCVIEMWGTLDHWYLQRFRLDSVRLDRFGCFITSSFWFAVVVGLLLTLLWFTQRRLQHRHASRLIIGIAILETIILFILIYAQFHLLLGPLV
jgi:hypothetical protein